MFATSFKVVNVNKSGNETQARHGVYIPQSQKLAALFSIKPSHCDLPPYSDIQINSTLIRFYKVMLKRSCQKEPASGSFIYHGGVTDSLIQYQGALLA